MNNQTQLRQQFIKQQTNIGIHRQSYINKFIYSLSHTDNFLIDRHSPSPSQIQGFTIEQEKCISYLMGQMIFKAGESLKLPVSTIIVASSITYFFYSRVGHLDYDFRDVIMGAMFLACKSQETLRKSYEISAVFDYIFKVFEGQKMPIRIQVFNSVEYEYMRKKVIKMENEILFELGFQVYRLFDIPHRYIGGLFKSFQRHSQCKKICQIAWHFLNDFYKTNVCLYYPGQIIAAAAVYLALVKLNIKMPPVPWWILMEANIDSIQELIIELTLFYEMSGAGKYSLDWVSTHINEVGQKNKLVNVFPVNYYRRIDFDLQQLYKIKQPIIVNIPLSIAQQLPLQNILLSNNQQQININNPRQRERSRQKQSKKKKDKSKKDKKDKKRKKEKSKKKQKKQKHYSNQSQSKSNSRSHSKDYQRRQHQVQEQFVQDLNRRNNQQTPKILKQDKSQKQQMLNQFISQSQGNKQTVKPMQIGSAKGLLNMINSQLKKHENKKKQKNIEQNDSEKPFKTNEQKINEQIQQPQIKDQDQSNSDEQLMAQLIKIRKNNLSSSNKLQKQ